MKKTYLIILASIILCLIVGFYLGWLDNGPRDIDGSSKKDKPSVDINKLPDRFAE